MTLEGAGDVDDRDAAPAAATCSSRATAGCSASATRTFLGSLPGAGWCPGPTALAFAQTPHGPGYWMLLSDGQVVSFGNAKAWGQPADTHAQAVALAAAK